MKHLLYISFILLSIFSCNSQDVIFGDYKDATFDTKHNLKINPDTTFSFFWKSGLINGTKEGTWEKNKNKLILNSFITQDDIQSFHKIEECDTCNAGINIKVIDFESNFDMQYASIYAFDKGNVVSEVTTNENGNAIIKYKEIDSLKVDFVGYNSLIFMHGNDTNKLFVINMKLEELNRSVITNDVWKIKKNQLISPNGLVLIKQ